ncbi:unnamed protein product [Brassica rapa subsp. trilocularis]
MSSSQFAIFYIVLIAVFSLHEFVSGQVNDLPVKRHCQQMSCANGTIKTCFCCLTIKKTNRCYWTKRRCMRRCEPHRPRA